jgi:hypothetical protein
MKIFHRAANTVARASLIALLAGTVALVWLLLAIQRSDWLTGEDVVVAQPIQFSHERHAGGNGIDCRYCHVSVETAPFAGLPPTQTCMNCHARVFAEAEGTYLVPGARQLATWAPVPSWKEPKKYHNLCVSVF